MARKEQNAGRNLENSSVGGEPKKVLRDWLTVHTLKEIPEDTSFVELIKMVRSIGYTEEGIKLEGNIGRACMVYNALRANARAGQGLVDRCLGVPDKGFSEKVKELSLDEVEKALADLYIKQGLSEDMALHLAAADMKAQVEVG